MPDIILAGVVVSTILGAVIYLTVWSTCLALAKRSNVRIWFCALISDPNPAISADRRPPIA